MLEGVVMTVHEEFTLRHRADVVGVVRSMIGSATPPRPISFSRVQIATSPGGLPGSTEVVAKWDPRNPSKIYVQALFRQTIRGGPRGYGYVRPRRQNVEILWYAEEPV
jgi:hypothetical protein